MTRNNSVPAAGCSFDDLLAILEQAPIDDEPAPIGLQDAASQALAAGESGENIPSEEIARRYHR